jgi:prolyl-tRNA synthetase
VLSRMSSSLVRTAPMPVGEDTFALCGQCGYAANVAAVPAAVPPIPAVERPPIEVLDTPDTEGVVKVRDRRGGTAEEVALGDAARMPSR